MKKLLSAVLSLLFSFFCILPGFVSFASADDRITEQSDDGCYLVIETGSAARNESGMTFIAKLINFFRKLLALFSPDKTVEKTKTASYYDSNGTLLWSVSLTGSFSYNGKTSVCTAASISSEIYDKDWKLTASDSSKDGSSAKGYFAVRQYKLGVPLKLIEKNMSLECDCHGSVR